ncbi:MAG: hypothetical protein M3347_00255 [Armatimonadota bacterium]|nr:hypothetical protein [Armatimonadota bacterium]
MPTLKDTEWRILCVIVRQTIGWQGEQAGQRKTSDWLSQSQLQARTGRATEALSRAIDTLVRRRLVEVRNDRGELLLTPDMRRHYGGRLFFSLSTSLLNSLQQTDQHTAQSEQPSSKSEFRKANFEKRIQQKKLKQNYIYLTVESDMGATHTPHKRNFLKNKPADRQCAPSSPSESRPSRMCDGSSLLTVRCFASTRPTASHR